MTVPTLAGQRCTLRELNAGDAPSLARHADDEAVWRNLFDGFPRPYTMADAVGWCAGGWRDAGHVWGIAVQDEVIGCVGIRPDNGWLRCNAEAGWWIGQAFWRRGITSEAVALASAWALGALPELTRLYAPVFSWNEGSTAVARRCGYVQEGVMRRSAIKAGQVIDRALFARYRAPA
ncbi:GNAT family N-acetyltransferase [Ideonella sp. BN130291]|uniref:GNAT family N-acetyltransferase n=1 Tax=Ideonella sp. BN130291 TaxID=3112940 RepID=UPI002E26F89D|nr:GNAT family N-acetyltransferase [Ideonella sp. BN130291]